MQFEFPKNQNSIIKVIGVGGGGGNAVNNMYEKGIEGVNFIVCNTDIQALKNSPVPSRLRLGANQTEGLGAGADPEIGKKAAMESLDDVRNVLKEQTKMVFVTAGMGGGTGTGAAPVIANMAREMDILTVGIVTTPFRFEGPRRSQAAIQGLKELEEVVDTLIIIDNNNLYKILGNNVTMRRAFEEADKVLCDAAKGIAEIITTEGYINVDFADVCTIMRNGGKALMGTAVGEGEERSITAVEEAINSPLLDNISMRGARGIIVNITASEESLRMDETTQIIEHIQASAGHNANIIYGIVYDEDMGDKLRVTVIATRFEEVDDVVEVPESLLEYEVFKEKVEQMPVEDRSNGHAEPKEEFILEEQAILRKREELRRRLNRKEREDRMKKLNSKAYDIHDPESLEGLESVPAYIRKKIALEESRKHSETPKLSRLSIDEDKEQKIRLKENNSFLHDNPD